MTDRSLSHILADMEVDADISAELEKLEDGDLIAVWLGSTATADVTRRQQLARGEIGRRGLTG